MAPAVARSPPCCPYNLKRWEQLRTGGRKELMQELCFREGGGSDMGLFVMFAIEKTGMSFTKLVKSAPKMCA